KEGRLPTEHHQRTRVKPLSIGKQQQYKKKKTSDRNPDPDPLDKSHNPHLDHSLSTKAQASNSLNPKSTTSTIPVAGLSRFSVSSLSLLPCLVLHLCKSLGSPQSTILARYLPIRAFLTVVSVFRVSLAARKSDRDLVVPARSTDFHPSIHPSIQTVKVSIPRRFFSSPTTTTTSKSTQTTYWRRSCTRGTTSVQTIVHYHLHHNQPTTTTTTLLRTGTTRGSVPPHLPISIPSAVPYRGSWPVLSLLFPSPVLGARTLKS
ncbi:hypothetical protein CNYM01_13089, partial [Colletotrichum nymphaeae SA-01]